MTDDDIANNAPDMHPRIGPRSEQEEKDNEIKYLKERMAGLEKEIQSMHGQIYALRQALKAVL